MERARAYLRAVVRGEAIVGPSLLILLLLLATVWMGYRPASPEATGQEKDRQTPAREATSPVPQIPELSPPELPKAPLVPERSPVAIPGLSEMDVIGYLQYLPGSNFRCPGGGPAQGGLYSRSCTSSSDEESPITYEVTLVKEDPSTVRSVTANAYDASDDDAADFFSYVAELSLEDRDPMNPETWMGEHIASGGEYLADGARLRLYGTEGARTMEIVATGTPRDRIPKPPSRPRPKDRD
jgi:hypothetical protein